MASREPSKRSVQFDSTPVAAEEVNSEDLRLFEEAAEDEGNAGTDLEEQPVKKATSSSMSGRRRPDKVKSVTSTQSRSILRHLSFQSSTSVGVDSFHEVMAACFDVSQSAVMESHERALGLLGKCMEEMKKKEKINRELLAQLTKKTKNTESERPQEYTKVRSTEEYAKVRSTDDFSKVRSMDEYTKVTTSSLYQVRPAKSLSFPERAALCVSGDDGSSADSFSETLKPPTEEGPPTAVPPFGCAPSLAIPQVEEAPGDSSVPGEASRSHSEHSTVERAGAEAAVSERSNTSGSQSSDPLNAKLSRARRPSMASNASMQSCINGYELLPIWTAPKKKNRKRNKMGKFNRSCSFESLGSCESLVSGPQTTNCCGRFTFPILDPNSVKRAAWDITATLLIIYDIVAIPLLLFELQDDAFSMGMDWTTRLFWTFDLFVSFITGRLLSNGNIEMRPAKIARKYLTSWFLIDVFVVASDWIEVLWSDGSFMGFARAGKASRTLRLLRMVRLVRLARVRRLYSSMLDRLKSEQLVIIAGIINIMLVIMALSHVIACIWYGISTQDRPDTWLRIHHFEQAPFGYKYTTSLHWALLQFAGGTDEIVPQNTDERIYAVGVFLLAFVMAAVFVGRLTSSMTQLHMLSRKDVERFQTLRKYLAKNEISPFLSMRVMHNAQHALLETQRFMEESRVELLSIISEPLRVELHFELYSPVLAVHPFFHCFIEATPQAMKKVCHRAMSQLLVSDGDIVFMPGEVPSPPRMIIVCSGELSYTYMNGAVAYVQAGQCISEAVLWCSWTHQGMLKAAKDCRLCILDANLFCSIVDAFDHDFDIRTYARKFVSCLNNGTMDVSDLPWDEGCGDLMEAIDALSPHDETMTQTTSEEGNGGGGMRWVNRWAGVGSPTEETSTKLVRKSSVLMVMPHTYNDEAKSAWW